MRLRLIFGITLVVLGIAWGQETINYASVSGRVTDSSGAVVQGARATARQVGGQIAATPRDNARLSSD